MQNQHKATHLLLIFYNTSIYFYLINRSMNTISTLKVHIVLLLVPYIICHEMLCDNNSSSSNSSHDADKTKTTSYDHSNNNSDNNIEDLLNEEVSIGLVATNVGLSAMLWKLISYPVLRSYIIGNKEVFYGFSNGVCWYPRRLNFMNGDLRIGFFCLECRPLELIVNFIHFRCSNWLNTLQGTCYDTKEQQRIRYFYYLGNMIPCYLYFLHLKYKFIRICFFSFFATLRAICSISTPLWREWLAMYYWSELKKQHVWSEDNKKKLFIGDLIFLLIPYVSIDISWCGKNIKNE